MNRKSFKTLIRFAIYLSLTCLICFALLIGTTFGSKVAIHLVDLFMPSLSVKYGSGTINRNLVLEAAGWKSDGVTIITSNLNVKWKPSCILRKQLCLDHLSATDTNIVVYNSSKLNNDKILTINSNNSSKFHMPVTIQIGDARFNNINVNVYGQHYEAKDLIFSGRWLKDGLTLRSFNSSNLKISGISKTQNQPANVSSSNRPITLPEVRLPFPISVQQSHLTQSQIELFNKTFDIDDMKVIGNWLGTKLQITELYIDYERNKLNTSGVVNFTDNYPLNLTSSLILAEQQKINNFPSNYFAELLHGIKQQSVYTEITNDLSKLKIDANLSGDINTQITAQLNLLTPNTPINVKVSELNAAFSFKDENYIASNANLMLQGDLSQAQLKINGDFESSYFPHLNVRANTTLFETGVNISSADIKTAGGDVNLTGSIEWKNGYKWNTKAQFNDFFVKNISSKIFNSVPDSQLNGFIETKGFWNQEHWQLNIENSDLSGFLNQFPLAIKGTIEINSDYKMIGETFYAELLGSQVKLNKSTIKGVSSTDASIVIPDLSNWYASIRGKLDAKLTTIEPSKSEHSNGFDYNIRLSNFQFQQYVSETISADGQFFPKDNLFFKTKITSQKFYIDQYLINSLSVKGKGDQNVQNFEVNLNSLYNLQSKIQSRRVNNNWKIKIPVFDVYTEDSRWMINNAIQMSWDQQNLIGQVKTFCLKNDSLSACLKSPANFGKEGSITGLLEGRFDHLISPFLPPHLAVEGSVRLNADIDWKAKQKPIAQISLALDPGKAVLYPHSKISTEFDYQSLTLAAKLSKKSLKLESKLVANDLINWNTEVQITTSPPHKLNGYIKLNNIQLTPFSGFFPMYENLSGRVSSQLNLHGSLDVPTITGVIDLDDAEFSLVRNPTRVHNLHLNLKLLNQSGQLTGNWKMGEGDAKLSGNIAWPQGKLSGNLNISGDNLTLIQPPLAILSVSPDVSVDLAENNIDVNGAINVEGGEITIAPLPQQGVPLSDDVVFSDEEAIDIKEEYLQISSNLDIDVQDSLKIEGSGLSGNLSGKLSYRQEAESPPALFGNIKINKGIYRFLGQTLEISQGTLDFSGQTNNPSLNIEATKLIKDEDLNVGVRIVGTAQKPIVSLFSNPNKDQAEIVSYLIQGRGFNNYDDQANNSLLLSAALTLGTHLGDNTIADIGESAENLLGNLGISNLQLNANDDGKIAVSGFFGKKLRVKYGYGVFSPGYELSLRYYLLSQLYLESISSALGQSLDIYYRFNIE
ncbi:translocation/assembly module TamB domain-containing protein [Parashewanella spongiae]|nr:translocation/assembly module TamB domain-containing protein [Parashewanella spongiae]MCL1077357.1 translocation/assembly module TamB domain-containing protein [Parashewanella spongiae]